jgi:hypothetical protein
MLGRRFTSARYLQFFNRPGSPYGSALTGSRFEGKCAPCKFSPFPHTSQPKAVTAIHRRRQSVCIDSYAIILYCQLYEIPISFKGEVHPFSTAVFNNIIETLLDNAENDYFQRVGDIILFYVSCKLDMVVWMKITELLAQPPEGCNNSY